MPPSLTWQQRMQLVQQQQWAQQQLERQAAQNRQLNQSNLNYQQQQMAQHRAAPVIPPDPTWQSTQQQMAQHRDAPVNPPDPTWQPTVEQQMAREEKLRLDYVRLKRLMQGRAAQHWREQGDRPRVY